MDNEALALTRSAVAVVKQSCRQLRRLGLVEAPESKDAENRGLKTGADVPPPAASW